MSCRPKNKKSILLPHSLKTPTTSLAENCIEFEFQRDRNYYVDLRHTYFAVKLKLVWDRGYETCKTKEVKKENKEEAKAEEEETAEQDAPFPLVTHVSNILHSIFSDVDMYINNQQIYISNGLYAHKSYLSSKFKGAISAYKGVLHCEGYDYEEFPDETMEAPLSEHFFTRRMKILSRLDGFMLYGKLGVNFFSTSELLYPDMKIRLRLIRARPIFYMISDNPNFSLVILDCSLYTRRIALKNYYHKKRLDMLADTPVEFDYLKTLALITREFCTARVTTMKNFLSTLRKRFYLKTFSKGDRKCSTEKMASCCLVNWEITFSPILNCLYK